MIIKNDQQQVLVLPNKKGKISSFINCWIPFLLKYFVTKAAPSDLLNFFHFLNSAQSPQSKGPTPGLNIDFPESSFSNCKVKLSASEIIKHLSDRESRFVRILPIAGAEHITKKEVDGLLEESFPEFNQNYRLSETERTFFEKNVKSFKCEFKSKHYAKAFINKNFNEFRIKPIMSIDY